MSNIVARDTIRDTYLYGAREIAEYLYGTAKKRRVVYYQAERGTIPVFRRGATLCADKDALCTHSKTRKFHFPGAASLEGEAR